MTILVPLAIIAYVYQHRHRMMIVGKWQVCGTSLSPPPLPGHISQMPDALSQRQIVRF